MYDIFKENPEVKKEIEIRGHYLMMACDIEFSLLRIIMYCSPKPFNQKRLGEFTGMKMSEKINNAICDIKIYNNYYYLEFENEFDGLEEFKMVRNDMAHCVGLFPKAPDLSIFRIDFIEKADTTIKKDTKNKSDAFHYKEYDESYINDSLNRFKQIIWKLHLLSGRLEHEFQTKEQSTNTNL